MVMGHYTTVRCFRLFVLIGAGVNRDILYVVGVEGGVVSSGCVNASK